MIDYALKVAEAAHNGQTDKAGRPYLEHVTRVWQAVSFEDERVQIAALLHDVVEHKKCTLTGIRIHFGTEVSEAVDALTRRENERYEHYIARLSRNAIAVKVKKADLQDNMRPERVALLPKADWWMVTRYQKSLNYLESL